MIPFEINVDVANVDADGLADGNSSASTSVTLDGALTSGGTFTSSDGLGRRIVITDAGADDQSGATYTVTGTDVNDNALSEDITGPGSGATVTTTNYFKTVTAVSIASPAATSTVDIGTADEAESRAYPINYMSGEGAGIATTVTGTINYTVQETFTNILLQSPQNANWKAITAFSAKTADVVGSSTIGAIALRVIINSHSAGGAVVVEVSQP